MDPAVLAIHWLLELSGGLACTCAQRYCRHRLLRGATWLAFSVVSTIVTVHLVG